jgi:hypothetical protein
MDEILHMTPGQAPSASSRHRITLLINGPIARAPTLQTLLWAAALACAPQPALGQERATPTTSQDPLPTPNPYARTNAVNTGRGRQATYRKLDAITLDEVSYRNSTFEDVIADLSAKARLRDPEGRGLNFIFNPNVAGATADGSASAERVDWGAVRVNIYPPLRDLRLRDVLDLMVMLADRPLKYSVEDYAVVFSVGGSEPRLYSRTFKVDPNTFQQGLEGVVGIPFPNTQSGGPAGAGQSGGVLTVPRVSVAPGTGTGAGGVGTGANQGVGPSPGGGIPSVTTPAPQSSTSQMARRYFSSLGLDLAAPKSVFFNDRTGILAVHASAQDLDMIEKAVGGLSAQPASRN